MYKKLVFLFLLVLIPTIVSADLISDAKEAARLKSTAYVTIDTIGTPVLRLKWIGSGVAATVCCTVTTNDLWFRIDGTILDSTIVAPTAGLIDVSNASYDTWGEVVAAINGSPNWQCQLLGALPSHLSTTALSSSHSASTAVCSDEGMELYGNPEDEYDGTLFCHTALTVSGSYFYGKNGWVKEKDFFNTLYRTTLDLTYASGATYIDVYAVNDTGAFLMGKWTAAATTVEKDLHFYGNELMTAPRGWRIVVFPSGAATTSASNSSIVGKSWNEHDISDGMR